MKFKRIWDGKKCGGCRQGVLFCLGRVKGHGTILSCTNCAISAAPPAPKKVRKDR